MKKIFYYGLIIFTSVVFGGCVSNIDVQTVRPYENRYSNETELVEAARTVVLEKGESVWLLTNSTLKRLLTNLNRK